MLIDTHTHIDAPEFDLDRDEAIARARNVGVNMMIILPGAVEHFESARACVHRYGFAYTLGIHPMWTPQAKEGDLELVREAVQKAMSDPRFMGVGEIGLDFYVPELMTPEAREKQEHIYSEQLKIARDFELPVVLHVRRSQDTLLKYLRRIPVSGGFAHAFNGSDQQAHEFLKLGFKLGFGGAVTYSGSQRIRHLAATLPDDALVLETDSPDIPPEWITKQRNEPMHMARIAEVVASLRGVTVEALAATTLRNAQSAMPRLAALMNAN
jgi:TatD DNase family protein